MLSVSIISNICIYFPKQGIHEVYVNTRVLIFAGKNTSCDGSGLRKQPHHISRNSSLQTLHMTEVSVKKQRADSASGGKKRNENGKRVAPNCSILNNLLIHKIFICSFCLHLLTLRQKQEAGNEKGETSCEKLQDTPHPGFFKNVVMKV